MAAELGQQKIRNFCILAHIDHGKSTLADRFLEVTRTVERRKMHSQYLDQMELEQERGITIKMQPVRMRYAADGAEYVLNLIDTPGHVDFTYEVSRALAAVEGAILLVDATQGVQAQTIANLELARREGLAIVPAVNKIDLPSADPETAEAEIRELLGDEAGRVLKISGKTGAGVEELLREVIRRVPPPGKKFKNASVAQPKDADAAALRALVFDSKYDAYQGVIAHVRVFNGAVRAHDRLKFLASRAVSEALEVGTFAPERVSASELRAGEIGYIATGVKATAQVRVGDTITRDADTSKFQVEPLPGYREPVPMVFASLFPENQDDYEMLRDALGKLKLEDSALFFEPEDSPVLGRGYRAGFLGMLHMEIITERMLREYDLRIIVSNPSVAYRVKTKKGAETTVYSAAKMPNAGEIAAVEEPWTTLEILVPPRYLGALTTIIHERRGIITATVSISGDRLSVRCEAPLGEIIVDFHDALKNISQGFASMRYEPSGYRAGDLVRLDILVAGEPVHAFSEVVPRPDAYRIGRSRVEKLKELVPKALFPIALQAEAEGRVIARATIPALKKDVTGYLYGGDRTRKMKLWKKQQRGKKRLKEAGGVEIPTEVFLKMIKKQQ